MKYSKLFGKTVRDVKKGMVLPSHKLLYKAGFTRELSTGIYKMLPLGYRTYQKIVNIIDKEMQAIDSQRISIPILQPLEFWMKSNRDKAWGNSLMKVMDRTKSEYILSATGEGVITEMVAETKPSYKDLPIIIHQIIIKIRDEKRPRGGLLRAREFDMKDAYSYHTTEEDFMNTYNNFYKAYENICRKLNIPYYACIADSGALGGDFCHEFQIPCDSGEDHIVRCSKCSYAANVEKAAFKREEVNKDEKVEKMKMVEQPWERARKIEDMVKFFKKPLNNMIKSVMYKTSKGKFVIAVVTGNLEVNDVKLAKAVGEDELEKATEEDLVRIGAEHGTLHAWGYEKHKKNITFVADESIVKAKNLCGGYKTKTQDPINVNYGRDFSSDIVADIAEPYNGAHCVKCGGPLELIRSIEFGHIFKYDHFYTKHHNGYFIDKDGKEKLMFMGAYGIGIGRAMAITVEKHYDDKGIIWPISVAPYQVHFITLDDTDVVSQKAQDIYTQLTNTGIEVLWDDREDATAGVKFADADLIGIPIRLVLSKRSLSKDGAEMKLRRETEATIIELDKVLEVIKQQIELLQKELQ